MLFAVSSLLLSQIAVAATRPHYGGTLHAAMRATPMSLDPADLQTNWPGSSNLAWLLYDTLITLDDHGKLQPSLATSWQSDPDRLRWQVSVRQGVKFQDGAPLTSDVVAASLRAANPTWKVFPASDYIIIERDSPDAYVPAELALARNGIVKRNAGKPIGTGPFAVNQWDPGKRLVLAARDDYWAGRAFVDSIEVDLGKSFRDQLIALEFGKSQVIEVAPDQGHRVEGQSRRAETSAPSELMAILFTRERQSAEEDRLRNALALSIDRATLSSALLQGGGSPAGGLLPAWMTGYGFVFPVSPDLEKARRERAEVRQASPWSLGYDANDPIARVVAERIALNARDADILIQLTTGNSADLRTVRVPLASLDAHVALAECAAAMGLTPPRFNNGPAEGLYAAENALVQARRVIPLLHVRNSSAVHATVKGWTETRDGSWRLQDVWLSTENP